MFSPIISSSCNDFFANCTRQFQIEEGELKSYNNITLTANDELLQECLNEKSDSKLRIS